MVKKILSILIAICITGILPVTAEKNYSGYTIIKNGNFEQKTNDWTTAGAGSFEAVTKDPAEGTYALAITSEGNAYVYQKPSLVAEAEYTLTFQVKGDKGIKGAVKVEMYNAANESTGEKAFDIVTTGGKWESKSYKFTVPANTSKAVFLLRLLGGGTIYYDDVYLEGELSDAAKAEAAALEEKKNATIERTPMEGAKDLMVNGGYEELDANGNPAKLEVFDKWGTYATVEKKDAHSGQNCIKISTQELKYPWVRHTIRNLMPGAKYQLTAWYKSDNDKFAVKFEFYGQEDTANPFYNQAQTSYYPKTDKWTKLTYTVTIPTLADYICIYVRNFGVGTIWADDLEFKMVELPKEFEHLSTDQVFYYPERTTGTATLKLNGLFEGTKYAVDFSLSDGAKVLSQENGVKFIDNTAQWSYDLSPLKEKKKAYTVTAKVTGEGGFTETLTQNIYRFDRPKAITENGVYKINGKPFNGQILYHIYENDHVKEAYEAGVTVIQGALKNTPDTMLAYLDEMDKIGMKVAIPLYFNMKPAGHTSNIEVTKKIVEAVKNHPAVFGYLIQDEPFAQGDPKMHQWLEQSYYAIRTIDDTHPVIICECFPAYYAESAKYVDMLVIDPYPGVYNDYLTHIGNSGEKVEETLGGEKPTLNLLQTFTFNGGAPKVGDVRHMAYQSYLAGQQYIGFYPWKFEGNTDKVNLNKSIWWDEIVHFNKVDRDILFTHFTTKQDPTYNKYKDNDIWYESWVKGNDVYVALINRTRDAKTAEVSLVSSNGKVKINDFSITAVSGGKDSDITKGTGGFSVKLSGADSILYKVTPNTVPDYSQLTAPAFDDIADYSWATDAIEKIYSKGIANTKGEGRFAPGESITRGDFAMFLIRTLGITNNSAENFADVPSDAEYAKEIAAGKAAGILNGIGDNKFNPEATITRQDMMTIISRGMGLKGETDLTAFSDSDKIADYALSHVKEMIASGLIKGNADGTINPLGNTTRAEAAVIMYRILGNE